MRRAPSDSAATRARNDSSTAGRTGGGPRIGSAPCSWSALSAAGSSSRASGFPAALRNRVDSTSAEGRSSSRPVSNALASSSASTPSSSSGIPGASKRWISPSRTAISIAIRSASSRRATNSSASAEGPSSHWASSTQQRIGASSEASASRLNTPSETRKRSSTPSALSPNALPRAAACGAGRRSTSPRYGRTSWWIPANGSSCSASMPTQRSTFISAACSRAYSSRAVFPIPGTPRRTRAALFSARASSSSASSLRCSASRPTSMRRS